MAAARVRAGAGPIRGGWGRRQPTAGEDRAHDTGLQLAPGGDALKQLGATLASYGSLAMFHIVGVTPEARTLEEAFGGRAPRGRIVVEPGALERAYRSFVPEQDKADLVVFGTPHLSLFEVRYLAELLRGRRVHGDTMLLLTTNQPVKALADRLGYTAVIEAAGGKILAGPCYYIMTPRELARRHGFRTIVTDLVIRGSGLEMRHQVSPTGRLARHGTAAMYEFKT